MKLTLTLHSRHASYTRHIALRTLVSGLVLASLVFLISSRSSSSDAEDYARVQNAQAQMSAHEAQLSALNESVGLQLSIYAEHLAELRHKLTAVKQNQQMLANTLEAQDLVSAYSLETDKQQTQPQQAISDPILEQIKALQSDVALKQNQLLVLEKLVSGHHVEQQVTLSGRPIRRGWLSSHFGMRDDPFTGEPALHKGLDFAGKSGAEVLATGAGIVTWSGTRYGYGELVEIDHGGGVKTRYGHNASISVKVGDVVTKGQAIATIGSTGRSTGAHVHYEVLKHGQQVDPVAYLR